MRSKEANMALEKLNWAEAVTLASPYPYVLGVANSPDGKPNAIGLCWWTFTSVKPPLLIISVAPERYSHECLKHSGEFGVA